MARGRGRGRGKSAAAQLGREICGEVGRARGDSEADRPAPEAQPPTTKPWTDDDRALVATCEALLERHGVAGASVAAGAALPSRTVGRRPRPGAR